MHNLDVANWVIGDHPVRATGIGGRAGRPGGAVADPNSSARSGTTSPSSTNTRTASACSRIAATSPAAKATCPRSSFGSKGRAASATISIGKKQVGDDQIGGKHRDAYVQEHIDLLDSIRAGKPLNELRQVAESTFTAILGRNAAYAERWLKWDDALAANDGTMPEKLALDGALPATPAPTPGAWKLPKRA